MASAASLFRSLLLGGLEISDLAAYYLWAVQWQSVGVAVLSFGFSSAFPSVVLPQMLVRDGSPPQGGEGWLLHSLPLRGWVSSAHPLL